MFFFHRRKPPPKRELTVDDVSRHLVFSFNGFLDRQAKKDGLEEDKMKKIEQAKDLLKEAFDIPDDDSLKISQSLERIFLQNCSLFRCEKPAKRAKKASNAVKKARDLLKEAFDIPNDDSLKLSRNLELIFLQNNRREIPIPPAPEVEPKEVSSKYHTVILEYFKIKE